MTIFVNLNIVSAIASQSWTTMRPFSPNRFKAKAKSMLKTTICSTSPSAMALITDSGKTWRRKSPQVCGAASFVSGGIGGRTTPKLSNRFYTEAYAAYGFKDEKWKYFVSGTYSINNKTIYAFPLHYLRASFQRDTKIPGQELQFVQEDNFLLSFKRGDNNKWLYNDIFRFDYVRELNSHFSYTIGTKYW